MLRQPQNRRRSRAERVPRAGRRRVVRTTALVLGCAAAFWLAVVVVTGITMPGNDSTAAKIAESARDHGLGPVVTLLEEARYRFGGPAVGGAVTAGDRRNLAADAAAARAAERAGDGTGAVPLHDPMPTPAGTALPGEGVFRPVVVVHGRPVVQVALVRPDARHTSYLAGVAWMSGRALRFVQHPGATDPGGHWSQPPFLPASERAGLVATFNSAFKVKDSKGGYLQDGRTVGRLRAGAASFVVFKDGHATVGAWGRDVRRTPDVVSVRQNLDLLVDGGVVNASSEARAGWGATVGSADYVWRSGIGVTATGDLVYVGGDALSARSLGTLLVDAGAVRAMELDINPDWVSYMWYPPGTPAPQPHKLVPFKRPAARYLTPNNRDFFAVYAR